MKKSKKSFVFLTGGLGNQLFQLAFLMTRDSDTKIAEITLGRPRINPMNLPDVFDFNFSPYIEYKGLTKDSAITRKFIGYLLRAGLRENLRGWKLFLTKCIEIIANIVISINLHQIVKAVYSRDNGYNHIPSSKRNEYLIGYFQSYRWLSEAAVTRDFFNGLKLKNPSEVLVRFLDLYGGKKTLAIHVRLGDYLLDPTLGVLDYGYYERAIRQLLDEDEYEEIWLFSNEPKKAMLYIPDCHKPFVRTVPDFSGSAAETLEAMRHASAYVIANSSLSWWGATLSYSENPKVIAPKPWFAGKLEPRDLIPSEWNQIER